MLVCGIITAVFDDLLSGKVKGVLTIFRPEHPNAYGVERDGKKDN